MAMLPFVAPTSCRRGTNYFTATPEGELKVEIAGCGVKIPVAGVMAYCDTVWELRLATNSFPAPPGGKLKGEIAGCGVKIPVAGVRAYGDPVWELRLATNIQIPSL